ELRVLAHISGDPVLRASFESGEDLHARIAGETFGIPPSEVTRRQRDIAKMINYGIAYGLSAFGLAHRLGLEKSEAADIIERYFDRYGKVKQWLDDTIAQARTSGMVKTMFGRRRYLPDINSKNPAARSAAERTAVNTPIQGTAADLRSRDRPCQAPRDFLVAQRVHDHLRLAHLPLVQGKRHHQLPGPKGAGRAAVQRRLRGSEPAAALVLQRRLVGIERHLLDAHLARPPTDGVALLVGRGERALRADELPRPGVTGDAPRFRRGA